MADRVEQHDAVVGEQRADLAEELRIVRHADVLEHADRNDAVEFVGHGAIVAEFEADAVR